ncbi:MAG: hypothetical protein NT051_04075 [Candidatus Micrarchaeota archaeon]|nr:hypothetical protein [Candidatus Micrarchaeota archaeon]
MMHKATLEKKIIQEAKPKIALIPNLFQKMPVISDSFDESKVIYSAFFSLSKLLPSSKFMLKNKFGSFEGGMVAYSNSVELQKRMGNFNFNENHNGRPPLSFMLGIGANLSHDITARGLEIFYSCMGASDFGGRQMAEIMYGEILARAKPVFDVAGNRNEGERLRAFEALPLLTVPTHSKNERKYTDALMVKIGYMSNAADRKLTAAHLQIYIEGMAAGIMKIMGLKMDKENAGAE